jgi:hypothetical protein
LESYRPGTDYQSLRWLTQIKVGIEETQFPEPAIQVSQAPKTIKTQHGAKIFPRRRLLGKVLANDRITVKAAHTDTLRMEDTRQTVSNERGKLFMMYQLLNARFVIAANADMHVPVAKLNQHIVQTSAMVQRPKKAKARQNRKPAHDTGSSSSQPEQKDQTSSLAQVRMQLNDLLFGSMGTQLKSLQESDPAHQSGLVTQVLRFSNPAQPTWATPNDASSELKEVNDQLSQLVIQSTHLQLRSLQGPEQVVLTQLATQAPGAEASLQVPVPVVTVATQTTVPNSYANPTFVGLSTQGPDEPEYSSSPQNDYSKSMDSHSKEQAPPRIDQDSAKVSQSAPQNVQLKEPPLYVEAFYKNQQIVQGASSVMRTRESAGEENEVQGLRLTHAPGHWPTYTRTNPAQAQQEIVPLVGEATLAFMSKFPGIQQDPGLGILLVQVPSGWNVELSDPAGEAQAPGIAGNQKLYFDLSGNYVGRESMETAGTVAFFNVSAGMKLIYLSMKDNKDENAQPQPVPVPQRPLAGAVTFPVFPGTASSVDLTDYAVSTVEGRVVIDNNQATGETSSLVSAEINVVGSSAQVATAGSDGKFRLENVLTFSNYPVFVEVSPVETNQSLSQITHGYKHRYEVNPRKANHLRLHLNSIEKVQSWKDQVPEGTPLVEDQGIVVAHLHQIMETYSELSLTPVIIPVLSFEGLRADLSSPEVLTCTLTEEDHLRVPAKGYSTVLAREEKKVIGFDLVDGFFEIKLIDQQGNSIFSSFFPASSNVINVFGSPKRRGSHSGPAAD